MVLAWKVTNVAAQVGLITNLEGLSVGLSSVRLGAGGPVPNSCLRVFALLLYYYIHVALCSPGVGCGR